MVWKSNTLELKLNYWQMIYHTALTPGHHKKRRELVLLAQLIDYPHIHTGLPFISVRHLVYAANGFIFNSENDDPNVNEKEWFFPHAYINFGVSVSYINIPMYIERGPISNKQNPLFIFPWVLMRIYFENLFFFIHFFMFALLGIPSNHQLNWMHRYKSWLLNLLFQLSFLKQSNGRVKISRYNSTTVGRYFALFYLIDSFIMRTIFIECSQKLNKPKKLK